jgi:hypothetical protein
MAAAQVGSREPGEVDGDPLTCAGGRLFSVHSIAARAVKSRTHRDRIAVLHVAGDRGSGHHEAAP